MHDQSSNLADPCGNGRSTGRISREAATPPLERKEAAAVYGPYYGAHRTAKGLPVVAAYQSLNH